MADSPYPTLDRLHEVGDERSTVVDFLEWINAQGMTLVRWREDLTDWRPCSGVGTNWFGETNCQEGKVVKRARQDRDSEFVEAGVVCPVCNGAGGHEIKASPRYVPIESTHDDLAFQFLDIDPKQVEVERRALLASLRG